MDLTELAVAMGSFFLPTPMVTDYKQVMKDRTTGSETLGAGMKDVTCRSVARFRNPWPNKVPKDRRGAGVRQKKNLSKTNSSKEIRTSLRLTSHGSSVLNLSKIDDSRTVGFDWSSRRPPYVNTRRRSPPSRIEEAGAGVDKVEVSRRPVWSSFWHYTDKIASLFLSETICR